MYTCVYDFYLLNFVITSGKRIDHGNLAKVLETKNAFDNAMMAGYFHCRPHI